MISIEEFLDIEMPADLQAEQAVIGSILIDGQCLETVRETLQGGEFAGDANKRIFRAMMQVADSGTKLDLVTLTSHLQDMQELENTGGVKYLSQLAGSVPSTSNVGIYAERVAERFLKRETIEMFSEVLRQSARSQDIQGVIAMAESVVHKISDQAAPVQEFKTIRDVMLDVLEQSEQRYNMRNEYRGVTGIASGFDDLDQMTTGFQDGDLIIVAARPSVGKTAFALNIAQNAAIRTGETIAFFSLEMSSSQLGQRMVSAEGNIDAGRMRTGFFEGNDWEHMSLAAGRLSETDIFIDDTPGITVSEIRSKCRRLKRDKSLGMVVIDYLQLIQGMGKGANRQEEVSQISRTLKQLARELKVPVIALSQLSRGVEQRQDKRPMMSDLRESGAIEQDADIVAFLYRDDYYDKESEKKNIIEIIIAKQRNGPTGTVELAFLKNYNKFVSLDRSHDSPSSPSTTSGSKIPDMYRGA